MNSRPTRRRVVANLVADRRVSPERLILHRIGFVQEYCRWVACNADATVMSPAGDQPQQMIVMLRDGLTLERRWSCELLL